VWSWSSARVSRKRETDGGGGYLYRPRVHALVCRPRDGVRRWLAAWREVKLESDAAQACPGGRDDGRAHVSATEGEGRVSRAGAGPKRRRASNVKGSSEPSEKPQGPAADFARWAQTVGLGKQAT
jgi:hypothetical protein